DVVPHDRRRGDAADRRPPAVRAGRRRRARRRALPPRGPRRPAPPAPHGVGGGPGHRRAVGPGRRPDREWLRRRHRRTHVPRRRPALRPRARGPRGAFARRGRGGPRPHGRDARRRRGGRALRRRRGGRSPVLPLLRHVARSLRAGARPVRRPPPRPTTERARALRRLRGVHGNPATLPGVRGELRRRRRPHA
ncbi:MAG: hypothetical protein AVDCRST_MAG79-3078, partial [uncultured Thermoleophilia bacterium]